MPGPEIAALLSRSLSDGIRSSLPLAAGIVAGKLLMLSAGIVGLGALLAALGPGFAALKYAGAAYLLWLGIKRLRAANPAMSILARAHSEAEMRHLLGQGADGAVLAERELAYAMAEMVLAAAPEQGKIPA